MKPFIPWILPLLCLICLPAWAQYQLYWGDVHGHTAFSDGKRSLDDYFTYARDVAKLDFVIVTDHDFGHAAPWRMPKEHWQLTQEKADAYTVDGKFVAIAGYEWTSQAKYWTAEEALFDGPVKHYNHKNVYFPSRVDYLFSAKDVRYNDPNLLAKAVLAAGGLIHNNHPDAGVEGRDQFNYDLQYQAVIVNTEMSPDVFNYQGKRIEVNVERTVQGFLNQGGKTGFVGGSDNHEGKTFARTAVLARALTREAIFEALRHRRNYAVTHARMMLDFKIDDHEMGEEVMIQDKPRIVAQVKGTDRVKEIAVVRDGCVIRSSSPEAQIAHFEFVDGDCDGSSYYYLRVEQADLDEHGNPSRAWSSPIWVRADPRKPAK